MCCLCRVYKNGLLLESRDGGRHWSEIPGSLFGFGAYRWSVSWGADDVLVLVGLAGAEWDARRSDGLGECMRIMLALCSNPCLKLDSPRA